MRVNSFFQNGFLIPRIVVGLALISAGAFLAFVSFAANPTSTSLSPTTAAPFNFVGTGKGGQADPSGTLGGEVGHSVTRNKGQWYCSKSTRWAFPPSNWNVMHHGPFT